MAPVPLGSLPRKTGSGGEIVTLRGRDSIMGLPVAALFPVISGHSDLGACQLPCCQSAGHCLASCDLGSLGLGSLPASALHLIVIWWPVFGSCCSLISSDQASVFTRMQESSLGSLLC